MESLTFRTDLRTRHFPVINGASTTRVALEDLLYCILINLDDVIVISPDFESHLQRLQDTGLKLKPSKCELLQDEVHYL